MNDSTDTLDTTRGPSARRSSRLNLSVPVELLSEVRAQHPRLNLSKVLRKALSAEVTCTHDRYECAVCLQETTAEDLSAAALSAFFDELLWGLGVLAQRGGTVEGAARLATTIARRHHIPSADQTPIPRLTRAEREALHDGSTSHREPGHGTP